MTLWTSRIVCVAIAATCLAVAFGGCAAFQNRAVIPIKEVVLEDGARISLTREVTADAFSRTEALSLALSQHDGAQAYATEVPEPVAADDLILHVDWAARRAWVANRRTKRVLLSADFNERRAWETEQDQPPWAHSD